MITYIGINNFRIFGANGKMSEFELRPLTILTGPNGSGKSSLLKFFQILKDNISKDIIKEPFEMDIFNFLDFYFVDNKAGDFNTNKCNTSGSKIEDENELRFDIKYTIHKNIFETSLIEWVKIIKENNPDVLNEIGNDLRGVNVFGYDLNEIILRLYYRYNNNLMEFSKIEILFSGNKEDEFTLVFSFEADYTDVENNYKKLFINYNYLIENEIIKKNKKDSSLYEKNLVEPHKLTDDIYFKDNNPFTNIDISWTKILKEKNEDRFVDLIQDLDSDERIIYDKCFNNIQYQIDIIFNDILKNENIKKIDYEEIINKSILSLVDDIDIGLLNIIKKQIDFIKSVKLYKLLSESYRSLIGDRFLDLTQDVFNNEINLNEAIYKNLNSDSDNFIIGDSKNYLSWMLNLNGEKIKMLLGDAALAELSNFIFDNILDSIQKPYFTKNFDSNDDNNNKVFQEIRKFYSLNLIKNTIQTSILEIAEFNYLILKYFQDILKKIFEAISEIEVIGIMRGIHERILKYDSINDKSYSIFKEFLNKTSQEYRITGVNDEFNLKQKQFLKKWLTELCLLDFIEINDIEGFGFKITLNKNGLKLNIFDDGFGYSMLIPMILMILNKTERLPLSFKKYIFLIEEPESHLHPDLQSKLADFFSEMTEFCNCIIETHSEYMIRKFQYLVAKKVLSKDAIVIYYFDKDPLSENYLKKITIDDNGMLSGSFGEGFVDEASRLISEHWDILRSN